MLGIVEKFSILGNDLTLMHLLARFLPPCGHDEKRQPFRAASLLGLSVLLIKLGNSVIGFVLSELIVRLFYGVGELPKKICGVSLVAGNPQVYLLWCFLFHMALLDVFKDTLIETLGTVFEKDGLVPVELNPIGHGLGVESRLDFLVVGENKETVSVGDILRGEGDGKSVINLVKDFVE